MIRIGEILFLAGIIAAHNLGHPIVQTTTTEDIPAYGKYFYADFPMGGDFGQHFANVNIGSAKVNMTVWVTTSSPLMGVATT